MALFYEEFVSQCFVSLKKVLDSKIKGSFALLPCKHRILETVCLLSVVHFQGSCYHFTIRPQKFTNGD